MKVIKRSGEVVDFDPDKIYQAVLKAAQTVYVLTDDLRQNQHLKNGLLNQFQQVFFMLRQGLTYNLVKTMAHRPSHLSRNKLGSPL